MRLHSRRERMTGPGFSLTVMRCVTHGSSWTVYPPGHVPYGRVSVAPLDLSGRVVTVEGPGASVTGTMFEAAADAESGERRPETRGGVRGTRRTQGRHLRRSGGLLGLVASEREQERIASALSVPLLLLREAGKRYGEARAWLIQSAAVMGILRAVFSARAYGGLLLAGCEAGLWGRPRRWDPGGHHYVAPF